MTCRQQATVFRQLLLYEFHPCSRQLGSHGDEKRSGLADGCAGSDPGSPRRASVKSPWKVMKHHNKGHKVSPRPSLSSFTDSLSLFFFCCLVLCLFSSRHLNSSNAHNLCTLSLLPWRRSHRADGHPVLVSSNRAARLKLHSKVKMLFFQRHAGEGGEPVCERGEGLERGGRARDGARQERDPSSRLSGRARWERAPSRHPTPSYCSLKELEGTMRRRFPPSEAGTELRCHFELSHLFWTKDPIKGRIIKRFGGGKGAATWTQVWRRPGYRSAVLGRFWKRPGLGENQRPEKLSWFVWGVFLFIYLFILRKSSSLRGGNKCGQFVCGLEKNNSQCSMFTLPPCWAAREPPPCAGLMLDGK